MKKIFLLLAVVGMIFTACEPANGLDEDNNGNQTEQPGSGDQGGEDNPDNPGSGEGGEDNPDNPGGGEGGEDNPDNPGGGDQGGEEIPADKTQAIKFQDENTKLLCTLHWDENEDGELSYEEAAAVTDLGTAFKGSSILAFTELKYFTSLEKIADNAFEGCVSLVKITIPEQLTTIGTSAFNGCTNLKKIAIPNAVTEIGGSAFANCSNLTRIDISDLSVWCKIGFGGSSANPLCNGAKLYLNGSELVDITIPSDITEIKNYAFSGYTSLTSVTIPDSVTSIGDNAFNSCSSLTSVTIPNSVNEIGREAFKGCTGELIINGKIIETDYNSDNYPSYNRYGSGNWLYGSNFTKLIIGNNITKIGRYTFKDYTSLTSVTIPDSVTSIGGGAFEGCRSLTSITIPDSVNEIGREAFKGCTGELIINSKIVETNYTEDNYPANSNNGWLYNAKFTKITIPDSVTKIGSYAFYNCSLTSVTIPDSVTEIGGYAFRNCTSLTSITIPDSVTLIGNAAFNGCTSLTRVDLSDLSAWCRISFGNSSANPLCNGAKLYLNGSELADITIPSDITGIKSYTFCGYASLESVTIPDSVTSIGQRAFYNCTSLTSVTIPDSVTSIGAHTFYNCPALKRVDYNGELSTWCNIDFEDASANPLCQKGSFFVKGVEQTEITIPSGVENIKQYAFCYYTSLTSVTIPDSVTSIGDYAFYNCTSLTSVTIPDSVTSIGYETFYNCYSLTSTTIGNGVTSIGREAFYNCTGELTVNCNIPSGFSYEYGAFYRSKFTKVTIGNSVTEIGKYAFHDCSLTSVTIGDSVTSIGKWAFYDCTGELTVNCNIPSGGAYEYGAFYRSKFTKVTIGNIVTRIGEYAFYECTSLTSVTIPDSVTSIGGSAFYNCTSLTSVTIPDSVTSIGNYAFENCKSLTRVDISDLSAWCKISFGIGDDANPLCNGAKLYLNGSELTDITIPSDITEIKRYAFDGCTSLTSVTIPNSVTEIRYNAFQNCTSLTSVYCKPITPPTGGSQMFSYYSNYSYYPIGCKIYVPRNSVEAYKAAQCWSDYASDIVGYDF